MSSYYEAYKQFSCYFHLLFQVSLTDHACRRSIDKFVKTFYVKSLHEKSKARYFATFLASNSFLLLDKKEKQNECK